MDVCFIEEQKISDVEIVENWNSKISRKITCQLSVCDSESTLTNVVKDYLRVLEQQVIKIRTKDMLKEKVLNHVRMFYYCSTTLKAVAANMVHFWKNMDDILVILCNLELDCARLIRTYNFKECTKGLTEVTLKLIYILSVFLLNDNQRICHVLLKLKAKANSRQWREVMKGVLRHFLLMIPIKDKSEESFCRNYLLFHSFKYALSDKNQNVMDAVLNNTFGMSPHSLTNYSLRKILLPTIESLQDFISDTSDSREAAVRNYFKYMNGKRTDDDDHSMSLSIDLESDSEEDAVTIIPNAPDTVITIDDDVKTEAEVCLPIFNMHRLYQEVLTVGDESDVEDASVPTEIAHIPACDNVPTSFWDGIMTTEEILIDTVESPVVEKSQSPHADLPSSPPDSFHKSYVEHFKCSTERVLNRRTITISDNNANIEIVEKVNLASCVLNANEDVHAHISDTSVESVEIHEVNQPACVSCIENINSVNEGETHITNATLQNTSDVEVVNVTLSTPVSSFNETQSVNEGTAHVTNTTLQNVEVALEGNAAISVSDITNTLENAEANPPISVSDVINTRLENVEVNSPISVSDVINTTLENVEVNSTISVSDVINTTLENVEVNPPSSTYDRSSGTNGITEITNDLSSNLLGHDELEMHSTTCHASAKDLESDTQESNVATNSFSSSLSQDVERSISVECEQSDIERNLFVSVSPHDKIAELSSDNSVFLSGIITPPVSDRTNDDIVDHARDCAKNVYTPHMIDIGISDDQYETDSNHCETGYNQTSSAGTSEEENNCEALPSPTSHNASNESHGSLEDLQSDSDEHLIGPISIDIHESEMDCDDMSPLDLPEMNETDLFTSTEPVHSNIDTPRTFTDDDVAQELESDNSYMPVIANLLTMKSNKQDNSLENGLSFRDKPVKCLTKKLSNKIKRKISSTKLNGDFTTAVKTIPDCSKLQTEKIVSMSSDERVSAPLSDFSKFELLQSELVRDTFSEPIGPICPFSNTDFEHSNSNDSVHSLHCTAALHENNPSTSPVSPPYEHIQAEDYQNHIMSANYNTLIDNMDTHNDTHKSTKATSTLQIKKASELISSDFQMHINSANRKRKSESVMHTPSKKVNFGPTEIRLISPNEYGDEDGVREGTNDSPVRKVTVGAVERNVISQHDSKLIEDEVLREAVESMKEYKIGIDDVKLVYLQPQIPVTLESLNELHEKEQQLKIRGLLHNTSDRFNGNSSTCIVKRVDYKKMSEQTPAIHSSSEIGHSISKLVNQHTETSRLESSIPSGYIPKVSYSTVHGLPSSNAMEQKENFNNHQQRPNNNFNDICNSEILNLSVSSTLNKISEIDSPESEFSRSPKLLQNSDQIVQQCLIDNLDHNEVEPLVNVHNNIMLLSNNSNFYSASSQMKLSQPSSNSEEFVYKPVLTDDKYKFDLDDLLLQSELDKLLEEKLVSCESETSLPLKKRRVVPKVNDPALNFKEEISYPATPMISIAEIEALNQFANKNNRYFKTAAERKEMPPIPLIYNKNSTEPTPIIADQFNINNHTYNNPTINYHMNTVPLPFINVPCAPYYSFPPFLVPFNNVTTYDANLTQDCSAFKKEEEPPKVVKTAKKQKKEKKKQYPKSKDMFEQFVPDKKFIY